VVRGSTTLNPQAFQFRLLSRDLLHP